MYPSRIYRHILRLAVTVLLTASAAGVVSAGQNDRDVAHDFHAMIPDDCRLATHDGTQNQADIMQTFAAELGLTGQQQQDLQILTADYGERLRDLAKLVRESAEKLLKTEPGTPEYWPLAQDTSAMAASSAAETVILVSELREKFNTVLTADQRAELKRRIEARKARCRSSGEDNQLK